MAEPQIEESEHSPLRNVTGGAGCGCGCLGLLFLLLGVGALAAIPLEMYPEGPGNAGSWGMLGVTAGLFTCLLGAAGFAGSLFMD